MKYFTFLFLHSLLISTAIVPIFDLSPWIVVENSTKLELTCQIEAICYRYDYEDENITLIANNNDDLTIKCNQDQDENGNDFMKFIISFVCPAEQTTAFNPIFNDGNKMFNPLVKSVAFTQESLQLTSYCDTENENQRYFAIKYQPESGITAQANTISIYVKCLNKFKQTVRNVIVAALNAANCLPY